MYKKAFLLAVLVLSASATSNKEKKNNLLAKAKAHFEKNHIKRDIDICLPIKCGKKGGKCELFTLCESPTTCHEGVCRKPVVGDFCYFDCYNDSLYCDEDMSLCREYDKEGSSCTSECYTKKENELICDPKTLKCKSNKAKPGEYCDYRFECQDGSSCTEKYYDGICYVYPSTVGAECTSTYGCDPSKYLYCNNESKCAELPKEGEECFAYCNKGFYCDYTSSTCKAQKEAEKECSNSLECKDGLTCSGGKCRNKNPKEGEYCDDFVYCDDDHKCSENKCVKKDGTCENDGDCAGFFVFCDNGKCKGDMGISSGEKCKLEGTDDFELLGASMQCKEDLACVPNSREAEEGTCKKVTAKKGKECSDDSDCPADAFCRCNDKEGKSQCIPIPKSDKDILDKAKEVDKAQAKCEAKGYETEEETEACYEDEVMEFYEEASKGFDYSAVYRCGVVFNTKGAASTVKVSTVAMAAALLFALLF